jgi:hypothetical protein
LPTNVYRLDKTGRATVDYTPLSYSFRRRLSFA